MIVNVSYTNAALHEAARFIWENNQSVTKWPSAPTSVFDVMTNIQETIRRGALNNAKVILKEKQLKTELFDEWTGFIGTGGYYISYELEESGEDDEIRIGATILVDPAVSHPHPGYVVEFVDEIEENV
jgi:hypothetical protein